MTNILTALILAVVVSPALWGSQAPKSSASKAPGEKLKVLYTSVLQKNAELLKIIKKQEQIIAGMNALIVGIKAENESLHELLKLHREKAFKK